MRTSRWKIRLDTPMPNTAKYTVKQLIAYLLADSFRIVVDGLKQELEKVKNVVYASKDVLNLEEAALFLDISKSSLYKMTHKLSTGNHKEIENKPDEKASESSQTSTQIPLGNLEENNDNDTTPECENIPLPCLPSVGYNGMNTGRKTGV